MSDKSAVSQADAKATPEQAKRFELLQELCGRKIINVNVQGPLLDDVTIEFEGGHYATLEVDTYRGTGKPFVNVTTSWEE